VSHHRCLVDKPTIPSIIAIQTIGRTHASISFLSLFDHIPRGCLSVPLRTCLPLFLYVCASFSVPLSYLRSCPTWTPSCMLACLPVCLFLYVCASFSVPISSLRANMSRM